MLQNACFFFFFVRQSVARKHPLDQRTRKPEYRQTSVRQTSTVKLTKHQQASLRQVDYSSNRQALRQGNQSQNKQRTTKNNAPQNRILGLTVVFCAYPNFAPDASESSPRRHTKKVGHEPI